MRACNSSTWEVEVGGSEVKVTLWYSEILGCQRPCLKEKKKINKKLVKPSVVVHTCNATVLQRQK